MSDNKVGGVIEKLADEIIESGFKESNPLSAETLAGDPALFVTHIEARLASLEERMGAYEARFSELRKTFGLDPKLDQDIGK